MLSWLKKLLCPVESHPQQIEEITALADRGRLETASHRAQSLIKSCTDGIEHSVCSYNIGVMHWIRHGDGIQARSHWLKTADILQKKPRNQAANTMLGDSCENLMLHSLGYEEYKKWASLLTQIRPTEPILKGQLPKIAAMQASGAPWCDAVHYIADTYYQVEQAAVTGMPACAASILHLLLANRDKFRLDREAWRRTLLNFTPLRLLVTSAACRNAVAAGDPESSAEISATLNDTAKYLEEYAAEYPGDLLIEKQLQHIQESLSRWNSAGSRNESPSPHHRVPADRPTWNKSGPVMKVISELHLGNIRFDLVGIGVTDDEHIGESTYVFPKSMHLTFRLASDSGKIPSELRHKAGLLLRCIVGQTVPIVASRTPSMQIFVDRDLQYCVNVGSGVPLHLFNIAVGGNQARFLEMRSDEDQSDFHVYVTPSGEYLKNAIIETAQRGIVMSHLADAFTPFRQIPLDFAKRTN